MKDFNWEKFKKGDVRVNVLTEESARDFLKEADKRDIVWVDGQSCLEGHKWACDGIYYIHMNGVCGKGLVFGEFEVASNSWVEIINWEKEEEKQMDVAVSKRIKLGELEEGKEYIPFNEDGLGDGSRYRRRFDVLEYTALDKREADWVPSHVSMFELLTWEFEEAEIEKETGWFDKENKKHTDGRYYYSNVGGSVCTYSWEDDGTDRELLEIANCFSTRKKAEEEANKDTLRRLMQRFADENNEGEIDWESCYKQKYYIYYSTQRLVHDIGSGCSPKIEGVVYFSNRIIAEKCIDEIVIPFKEDMDKE